MYTKGKDEYMHVRVVIEHDQETESFSAVCPELPGCTSCGDTEEEAMENVREAIALYLEPDTHALSPNAKVYEVAI